MGFLDGLEKLINEHGSAAILRERIALLNDRHSALEKQITTLKEQTVNLEINNKNLELDNRQLQEQIRNINAVGAVGFHKSNPKKYPCDHCAGALLKRTSSKPDPDFGDMGIKMSVFTCQAPDCGKQSVFSQD